MIRNLEKPKLIIIAGPTAVGKTAISRCLEKKLPIHLINSDSTKVYKNMSCGTNRRGLSQEAKLVNFVDPLNPTDFSCSQYYDLAMREIHEAYRQKRIPTLVGGSGLYLRWILYGKQGTPIRNAHSNEKLIDELKVLPRWEDVIERIASYDSDYAKKVAKNDYRRAARAIEICRETKQVLKNFDKQEFSRDRIPVSDHFDYRCLILNIKRLSLYEHIGDRCEFMIEDGLFEEVWELMKKGLTAEHNAGKAIGYRQTIEYLALKDFNLESFLNFAERYFISSRGLAHRQLNWFRHEPGYYWIENSGAEKTAEEISRLVNLPEDEWSDLLVSQSDELKNLSFSEMNDIKKSRFKLKKFSFPLRHTGEKREDYNLRKQKLIGLINPHLERLENIKKEMEKLNYTYPCKIKDANLTSYARLPL